MANDQRFYKRRESATAREITPEDIDAQTVAHIEPAAKAGDMLVSQVGQAPIVMSRARFDEHYEPADDTDNAAVASQIQALSGRVDQITAQLATVATNTAPPA